MEKSAPEWAIFNGDALAVLKQFPDNTFDSLVTDPPAGISFMGKEWDSFSGDARQPGDAFPATPSGPHQRASVRYGDSAGYKSVGARAGFIGSLTSIFEECLRVMKPGAHGLVWALPRTSHWTATALEYAGFEIRDCVYHGFFTGFPKALNVAVAIDKAAKGHPQGSVDPDAPNSGKFKAGSAGAGASQWKREDGSEESALRGRVLAPEARAWEGWGTALKPSVECWWLVRKPLEGTVTQNVLKWGTGALNIGASRIGMNKNVPSSVSRATAGHSLSGSVDGSLRRETGEESGHNAAIGRWPSHLVFSHNDDCAPVGTRKVKGNGGGTGCTHRDAEGKCLGHENTGRTTSGKTIHGPYTRARVDGTETVEVWNCTPDCPVAELDRQSGKMRARGNKTPTKRKRSDGVTGWGVGEDGPVDAGNAGSASRFFFVAKASRKDREEGCDDLPVKTGAEVVNREEGSAGLNNPRAGAGRSTKAIRNAHPTVKNTTLMRYLCRLVTPPGGLVLDCFQGSGSTGKGALLEGFGFVGIEREAEYFAIAKARIEYIVRQIEGKEEEEVVNEPTGTEG